MVARPVLWYQVTATACNALSLVILCTVLYKRRAGGANPAFQILRPFEAILPDYFKERRAASERHVSRLLSSAICAAYVAACLPQALGPFADAGPDAACRAVGAFSQAASLVVVVLHGFVAPRLAYAVVVGGRRDAARALGRSVPAVVAASAAAAAAIGAADPRAYGLATCWCWYRGERGGARPRIYGFFSFYLFAGAGALYSCWVLARVLLALRRPSMPSAGRPTLARAATIVVEAEATRGDVARRLVGNMLVFVVVWAVAFLARLVIELDPNARARKFALVVTLEVAVSLQGFCYGVLCLSSDDALRRLEDATIGAARAAAARRSPRRRGRGGGPFRGSRRCRCRGGASRARSGDVEAPAAPGGGADRDAHVATLNCAERGTLAELVGGGDVGAALEDLAPPGADVYAVGVQECNCWPELVAAVGAGLGAGYAELGRAQLGSAHLKGVIGVVVFARADDVAAGFVAAEARPRRAAASAAVAAALRARAPRRRGPPDPPTHVFMFGDLNYRAVPPDLSHPTGTLARVDAAMKDARRWPAALRDDELAADVAAGVVLAGFAELGGGPRFPPTFKRDGTGYAFLKDAETSLDAALGLAGRRRRWRGAGGRRRARDPLPVLDGPSALRVGRRGRRRAALADALRRREPRTAATTARGAGLPPRGRARGGPGLRGRRRVFAVVGAPRGGLRRARRRRRGLRRRLATAAAATTTRRPSRRRRSRSPSRRRTRSAPRGASTPSRGSSTAAAARGPAPPSSARPPAPAARRRADLVHGALARHALALEGSDGAPLGSAVLALPDAGAATVAAPLTLGGRAVGALTAVVTVSARVVGV
ncbi:hypothetical protein JL722_5878 [Aureococcus anophagefferens]|nr:hypothetical protein JL722_5878 [Aureococcus anophagefferens]